MESRNVDDNNNNEANEREIDSRTTARVTNEGQTAVAMPIADNVALFHAVLMSRMATCGLNNSLQPPPIRKRDSGLDSPFDSS